MYNFVNKSMLLVVAGYIFFNFLQFKGGKEVPQVQMIRNLSPSHNADSRSPNDNQRVVKQGNFIEKTLTTVFTNVLESEAGKKLIQNMDPSFKDEAFLSYQNKEVITIPIVTLKEGVGDLAVCGDHITFDYKLYNAKKDLIREEASISHILNSELQPELQALLIKRKSQEHFETQIYKPTENIIESYQIYIKDVKLHANQNPRRLLKEITVINGNNKKALCGDRVNLKLTVETTPHDQQAPEYKLSTLLGSKDLPRELTELLLGKRYGTKFICTANKDLLNTITHQNKKLISTDYINNDRLIIFTIELLENTHL